VSELAHAEEVDPVKIAIRTIAAMTPVPVRTCWPWLSFIQ
jgi:hypothetical protein